MIENAVFFTRGLKHVLDINAYDHVIFLMVLSVPFTFKSWKKALLLVTIFTLGHSISLSLAAFDVLRFNSTWIEFLIPVTILLTALYNMINVRKIEGKVSWLLIVATLFFGLVHGFGFSSYFEIIIGNEPSKLWPLVQFALGIEASQLIVMLFVLGIAAIFQEIVQLSKRDWILIVSAMVLGAVIPMIIESDIW
ncbi:HupE/UreJ family protein [Spongiivirga citrea]|uniref:HupE/UreJ family protein n=1 Tax=Spongiivirga citrea TaxID=1481457 RepID=A0A6M0CSN0_9FLAO|nr:HupE/UreJ family protein [Spongiivirga citrea]